MASIVNDLKVKKLAGACGAEIVGIDLAKDLMKSEVRKALHDAFLESQVIFFRGQSHLNPDDFMRVANTFGKPMQYPMLKGIKGFPMITEVVKREHETTNFGGIWHSDTTYLPRPPMGTLLLSREVPPFGGDTLFANQYLAYESLSAGLKRTLDPLRAIYSSAKAETTKTREDRLRDDGGTQIELAESHPVVRVHPETGRKALFVNVAHTLRFDDWTEVESAPLLAFLHQHQVKPEFTCRFKWEVGSLAFWDNRCVLHNPVNDYQGYKRILHRITLEGDVPA